MKRTFWSIYEEKSLTHDVADTTRNTQCLLGTLTKTAAREESDQDSSMICSAMRIIPLNHIVPSNALRSDDFQDYGG